jgi:hypothetical protein
MAETSTETEVVYFPPLQPTKRKKVADLAAARAFCEQIEPHGCNPLIQQRTVTVSEWVVVENWAMPLGEPS